MSNRLSLAHGAARLEFPALGPVADRRPGRLARMAGWLRGVADAGDGALSAAIRRDLGLPAATVPFVYDIERSRVRV